MSTAVVQLSRTHSAVRNDTPDFNHLARIYRWMEWLSFGPFLWRCRCFFLGRLVQHRRAIVIGDGDGRFAARLLQVNRELTLDAVDGSVAMLSELAHRAGSHAHRAHTHFADAREFVPARCDYDLVVTHFFLDCLDTDEIRSLASRLRNHTQPNAKWILSEFSVPAGWYGRLIARPLISLLYLAFAWLTGMKVRRLPDHRAALRDSGWTMSEQHTLLGGLLVSELWRIA